MLSHDHEGQWEYGWGNTWSCRLHERLAWWDFHHLFWANINFQNIYHHRKAKKSLGKHYLWSWKAYLHLQSFSRSRSMIHVRPLPWVRRIKPGNFSDFSGWLNLNINLINSSNVPRWQPGYRDIKWRKYMLRLGIRSDITLHIYMYMYPGIYQYTYSLHYNPRQIMTELLLNVLLVITIYTQH